MLTTGCPSRRSRCCPSSIAPAQACDSGRQACKQPCSEMQRSLPLGPLPAVPRSPCRHRATARRLRAAPARRAVAAEAGAAVGATEPSAAAAPGGQMMDMHSYPCTRLACSTHAAPHCLPELWLPVRSPRPGHGARTAGSAPHVLLRIACLSPGPLCACSGPALEYAQLGVARPQSAVCHGWMWACSRAGARLWRQQPALAAEYRRAGRCGFQGEGGSTGA